MNGEQNNMNAGEKSGSGLKIAVIVILVIGVLAGLYFWNKQDASEDSGLNETIENINDQSSSDDPTSIEADLESTDVENLDTEFNAS